MRSIFLFNTAYLSFRSLDDGTPEGRSRERYRLAALGSLASFLSSILGMVTLVLTVPLTLSYLGEERFGVWMTIGSLAALLSFLDLGVGNGLVNRVAKARAETEHTILPSVISHGLLVLLIVGAIVGVLLFSLVQYLPIARLIKVADPAVVVETKTSVLVFCAIFAASIPLGGLQKIFQGLQLTWVGHVAKGLGAILSLLLVYFLAKQKVGVPVLLLATYGVQTLVLLLLLYLIAKDKMLCFPKYRASSFVHETKKLLGVGGLFFVLQIGYLVGWSSDSLIVSSVLGAGEVTKLAVMQRLFQFVFLPLSIINSPLWGAYADANAKGDHDFISRTLRGSIVRTTVFAAVGCVSFVLLSPIIFRVWLQGNVHIPISLVATYGIWIFVQCVFIPVSMLLNGVGVVKVQVIVVVAFCIVCLPLKFYLVQQVGVVGVIQAAIIAYLLTAVIPYVVLLSRGSLRGYLARPPIGKVSR
jgi:O-antigen/teichoic acid export membrane protein